MQLHNLKRTTKNRRIKIIGRGSKRGKTSGRGTKGQNARAGHKKRPEVREIIKRLPKLRGYRYNNSIVAKPVVINVSDLQILRPGTKVTPSTLVRNKIIDLSNGQNRVVKILGSGNLNVVLNISQCFVSKVAKEKIEKAVGKVE